MNASVEGQLHGITDTHAHLFDPARFPYSDSRRYSPPPATASMLRATHDTLGLHRVVLVQPSVYGTDNRCLLDGLRQLGARARGVAVVDPGSSRSLLEDLVAAGVCGIRLNLAVARDCDPDSARRQILESAAQIDGLPMVLQVNAHANHVLASASAIRAISTPVVLDHFAHIGSVTPVDEDQLHALLGASNVFLKFSGPYQISTVGAPYSDVTRVAVRLAHAAAGRLIWGSDWPHTGGARRRDDVSPESIEPFRSEDDALLLRLTRDWVPDAAARARMLVETPARLFGF